MILRILTNAIAITGAVSWCDTRDARADGGNEPEPRVMLALAPSLGGVTVSTAGGFAAVGLLAIDASWRTSEGPWWLRGEVALGVAGGIDEGGGSAYELRAGIEHRQLRCGRACFYYGIDAAIARHDLRDGSYELQLTSVLAIPRSGIDIGGDRVRFRIGLELPFGIAREHEHDPGAMPPLDATSTPFTFGFGFTTALAIVVD